MNAVSRHSLRWLLLLTLLVIGIGYGLREPWPSDEPRFVLVAKQMVESGDWLFPHRGQELYPDKPPFYFWLLAASHGVIGDWRWSFLLPSLLSALLVVGLTFDLARRLHGSRAGYWAALAVLSCLQFVYQFKRAQIDPSLVALTTASFYAFCRYWLLAPDRRWLWLGGCCAGLGVITKGVGFLPLLIFAPALWFRGRGWLGFARDPARRGIIAPVSLAFVLPIALWLLPLLWLGLQSGTPEHGEYLQNILLQQTAQRYAAASGHLEPAWYFLMVVALYWLPFSLCFYWLWRDWVDAWRARDARVWLPLSWGLLVVVFFSLNTGKRDMYILPALPAFALSAAPYLDDWLQRKSAQWALTGFTLTLSTLLLVLATALWSGALPAVSAMVIARGLVAHTDSLAVMLLMVAALGISAGLLWRGARAAWASGALLLALWAGYGLVVHPLLDASSSASAVMRAARAQAGPTTEIGLVAWQEQNLLQAMGPTVEFGFRAAPPVQLQRALAWLDQDALPKRLFIGWYADHPPPAAFACVHLHDTGAVLLGTANRRQWWLLERSALSQCPRNPAHESNP